MPSQGGATAQAAAPTSGASTRSAVQADQQRLRDTLVTFFDVDNTSDLTYNADPIVKALTYGGVTRFNTEFVTLSEEDVNSLVYEDANNQIVSLPLMKRRLVITFIAYVHECSRKRSPSKIARPY